MTREDLIKLISLVDGESEKKRIRDKAILCLLYASGMKPGTFLDLDWERIKVLENRIIIMVPGSPTVVAIEGDENTDICPVAWLRRWRNECVRDSGPLFLGINRHGGELRALSEWGLRSILYHLSGELGKQIAPESFRRSYVTRRVIARKTKRVNFFAPEVL